MSSSLAQKLKIKEGSKLYVLNAPVDFDKTILPLPEGVKVIKTGAFESSGKNEQIHWFVKNKEQMETELNKILPLIKDDITCWIYYPKGSSKIQTDLTRDKGWDALLAHKELQWLSLISFNETWSAFAIRLKIKSDKQDEAKPAPRAIFNYINPNTKELRLPEDLSSALQKNENKKTYFNSLAFSHRKEYVEWIISAKREETRTQRIKKTIEMLSNKRKNPTDKL